MKFRIFSDGSSRGNPGPGGWAVIVASPTHVQEFGGYDAHTTNNRMELTGAIKGLHEIPQGGEVEIHTDSSYVIKGITEWVSGWEERGWKTRTGDDVLNKDLWETLASLVRIRKVAWKYVKGHAGNPGNERCDEIATNFALGKTVHLFNGNRNDYMINLEQESHATLKAKNSREKSQKQAYSYVSLVEGVIQTHATWKECEQRVKGVSGAKFKKALNEADENNIISSYEEIMKNS